MTPENAAQAQLLFQLLLLAMTVGNTVLIIKKLMGKSERREIGPSPLTVQAAVEYATKAELLQVQAHFESVRDDMRAENMETRARIDNLPDRIIAILRNTGAIK